jgi:ribosomal 30S subunit maturation factor RimM
MAKVTLRATGGLNSDTDPNNLPEGDYVSANNIVFDAGKDGGAGAIKMMESIKSTGVTFTETIKATFLNSDGVIYVLGRAASNGSTASIYKIPATLDSKTLIVTYTHGITTDFVPDLKVVGTSIVWNYAEEGTPLSFSLSRTFGSTIPLTDLKLQKKTPNNVYTITKTIGTGVTLLEASDFQFASRYQYDTGEYSALGAYSQMFKGEKDTANYTFAYSFSGVPTYVTTLETYVRVGNNGTWRRIDSRTKTETTNLVWTGQIYESLDAITTGKPFDAVPVNAKHIEIAKNRIFLANIKDDYDVTSGTNLDFTLSEASGYSLDSGTYNSYLGNNKSSTSSETGTYYKPFANDSTYAIGLAYYDEAMKTRGVEKYIKFKTGKFALPILPTINVALGASWAKPSWAKYAQLVYTKNISKAYIYEGYASNIFFQLNQTETNAVTKEVTTLKVVSQSVTKDQLKNIEYFAVDLMGMFRAGLIYTYQEGDRISINTPNGILDLDVVAQNANIIYCNYTAGEMTNLEIPSPADLYFEIYTPKQEQEEDNLLFYEYGNLIDMAAAGWSAGATIGISGAGTVNNNKLIGDMVFSKIEIPVYSTAPFLYNTQKTVPADITEDVITIVNGITTQTMTSSLTNNGTASPIKYTPILTIPSGTNGDGASLTSTADAFKVSGFYDIGNQDPSVNKMKIQFNLISTNNLALSTPSIGDPSGDMSWTLNAQVYRTPYNNKDNKYEATETFGSKFEVDSRTFSSATSGATVPITAIKEINLSSDIKKDISANDKFSVELTLDFSAGGGISAASVSIAKQSSSTYGMVITLNGDRTAPKTITTYNSNSEVSATKSKFLLRNISNAIDNKQWNTSAGKPSFEVKALVSPRRTQSIRYSGNYVAGTKVNNINSFFALDSNDVPIENGEITSLQRASRLQGNGAMMIVLCEKESAYIMLGEQELSQGNNTSIRSLTANMIGTIRNFGNNLGMLTKQSVMNYKGFIWWWDDFNKKIVKYTPDGLQIVSDIFTRSLFRNKSGAASFCYDAFYNMAFVAIGSDTQSMGFSDNLNRWIGAYDFVPNFGESYGDRMILFKNGAVYRSLESGSKNDYNSFLGASGVNGNISFILNSRFPVNPLNVAVWHNMNVIDWNKAADINGEKNYVKDNLLQIDITNENNQATLIREGNFIVEDNRLYAHIMRDTNTPNLDSPLIQGDYIVGYLNKFVVTLKDKTQNMRINSIDVEVASVSGHS